ncbi:MAG: hypothetical protein KDA97_10655 [Acidimicrobiales bacterium]|nr:hypothetical protein [Acidimicrobiales bacterium]
MKKKLGPLVALAVVAVVAAAAGMAYAGDDPDAQPPDPAPDQPIASGAQTNALLADGDNEMVFVPIVPCRIIDTRQAGGKLQVGGSRVFDVRGDESTFAAQGGTAGGCDIPFFARGIETTITAVDSGSSGFLRAYPAQAPAPNATFMNYTSAFNVSNTGTLAIPGCTGLCIANEDLRLRAYGTATHVVVEVNGYYLPQMGAVINSDGTIQDGNRVTRASRLTTGGYEVGFDRDVSRCAYNATLYNTGGDAIRTAPRTSEADAVYVSVEQDGSASDERFYLEVIC